MLKKTGKFLFLCGAPVVLLLTAAAIAGSDLIVRLRLLLQKKTPEAARTPSSVPLFEKPRHASIVIPNWNGRELLRKYLPSVVAACRPGDEVVVVDNASDDGSAEWVRSALPQVKVLAMQRNLGFGGGCNAGVRAARNRVVVLLNNDMRVTPGFLPPLLDGFTDEDVFAVSAQIFFSDPNRRREETGLTTGRFERGFLRVSHTADESIATLYPAFYAGGGSTAYDRDKFLELGGFDPLFEPFYLEDTDLSYCAWRRGWKVLYQPRSVLYHEHRATIGKHYAPEAIRLWLQKNYVLMVWKNVHRWRWLAAHFFFLYAHMLLRALGRETETRTSIRGFWMALRQLRRALESRRLALARSRVDDLAVFQRTRPAVFRETFIPRVELPAKKETDRVEETDRVARTASVAPASFPGTDAPSAPGRPLNILFVSPYSINPPLHGGAVFMLQAIRELAKKNHVYVLTFVDSPQEAASNRALEGLARKVETVIRQQQPGRPFSLRSHAQQAFEQPGFAAMMEKMVWLHDIDLIQLEYTQLAQYRLPLTRTPQCLFEHDVYFRSVQRKLLSAGGGIGDKSRQLLEWLRALRFEIGSVAKFDAVFTCHEEEARLLRSLLNGRQPEIIPGLRTGIDAASYPFPGGPREPDSLLFVGNFQHTPNVGGLDYFCRKVLPLIRARNPRVTLSAVGANALPDVRRRFEGAGVRWLGQVEDIREPLSRHAVFVCPILTGAGVRVKILEAFSSGIPVVSTPLGAEGLDVVDGMDLMLARSPDQFAETVLHLLENTKAAAAMAASARRLVETVYDWPIVGRKLDQVYRRLVAERRSEYREESQPTAVV